jgi:hypothetical protein
MNQEFHINVEPVPLGVRRIKYLKKKRRNGSKKEKKTVFRDGQEHLTKEHSASSSKITFFDIRGCRISLGKKFSGMN